MAQDKRSRPMAGRPAPGAATETGLSRLYHSQLGLADGKVRARDFLAALNRNGLVKGDARLSRTMANLAALDPDQSLSEAQFGKVIAGDEYQLVHRALSGGLVVPDFQGFGARIGTLFEESRDAGGGAVASYIPQLARVDPERYALGLCTIDGQQMSLGDDEETFCVQSTCKPINYAVARDLVDRETVHRHVGREPSGKSFNELTLNPQGLPHNPMINAGAIMCSSLIMPEAQLADRFDFVMQKWSDLAGGRRAGFDNAVFLSERQTADRNFALAYFMRENHAFPENTNLVDTLDFYFQCCSITVDVRHMAIVAATFANSGICPVTNRRVLASDTVKDCLSLMYSCGMYDYSGEHAFAVGIPAKSGVSGALMLVVPGVCGIALWSPRLDTCGNSVRGVQFSRRLVETFSFHSYANMVEGQNLIDPRVTEVVRANDASGYLCEAAARGDLGELRRLIAAGVEVSTSDYDGRTALHLAACEGRDNAVRLLIAAGCELEPRDRWGNTPLDDALREERQDIVAILRERLEGRSRPTLKAAKKRAPSLSR